MLRHVRFACSEDMKHAGNILIASLGRQPENALLHWAGPGGLRASCCAQLFSFSLQTRRRLSSSLAQHLHGAGQARAQREVPLLGAKLKESVK